MSFASHCGDPSLGFFCCHSTITGLAERPELAIRNPEALMHWAGFKLLDANRPQTGQWHRSRFVRQPSVQPASQPTPSLTPLSYPARRTAKNAARRAAAEVAHCKPSPAALERAGGYYAMLSRNLTGRTEYEEEPEHGKANHRDFEPG